MDSPQQSAALFPHGDRYAELATAAQACRAMAHQEGERAKTLDGTSMREPVQNASKRYAVLAEKLEAARRLGLRSVPRKESQPISKPA